MGLYRPMRNIPCQYLHYFTASCSSYSKEGAHLFSTTQLVYEHILIIRRNTKHALQKRFRVNKLYIRQCIDNHQALNGYIKPRLLLFILCHGSGGWSHVFRHGVPHLIPCQSMREFWPASGIWANFYANTSVLPCQYHYANIPYSYTIYTPDDLQPQQLTASVNKIFPPFLLPRSFQTVTQYRLNIRSYNA